MEQASGRRMSAGRRGLDQAPAALFRFPESIHRRMYLIHSLETASKAGHTGASKDMERILFAMAPVVKEPRFPGHFHIENVKMPVIQSRSTLKLDKFQSRHSDEKRGFRRNPRRFAARRTECGVHFKGKML